MPIQYTGILDEVKTVRMAAGIFDVSHMGRVFIQGPGAVAFIGRVFSSDVGRLRIGRARYGAICVEDGGILDDCIFYRLEETRFLLIPNASNAPAVLEWLSKWAPGTDEVTIDNASSRLAMIALQGPKATEILKGLTPLDLSTLKYFYIAETQVSGIQALVARTGYTGENGYEVMPPAESATKIWNAFAEGGAKPVGLGARDVLRLEAGLWLHGNDMDLSTNPYEAGMGRFIDPDREGYIPGPALRRIRDEGPARVLVGFTMVGRGIARHGYPITDGSEQIGEVTSGGVAPTLDKNIGLGYVPTGFSAVGSRIYVVIRNRPVEAKVTGLPFYSRRRSA